MNHTPPNESPRELLVVVGPTASGKTELAVRLAERLGGEIVSADSVQVYRRFDIGSGKPSDEQRQRARHHLIDLLEPEEPMDAARWAKLADDAITEIRQRGRVPIVCGGSFLWIRALLYGLAAAPPADAAIRRRHHERAQHEGRAALHAELARVDPEAAVRLSPNDFVRVSRALEVWEICGVPLSRWQAQHGFRDARHRGKLVGIDRPRPELDTRIRERTVAMLQAGWIAEVRDLFVQGHAEARAMRSVGYRQIADSLDAGISAAELTDLIVRATRVFARRQRTWLRDEPVSWTSPAQAELGDID
jgi:tRNA dimethylallyltransferase